MNKIKDLINNITLKRVIVSAIGGYIVGIGVLLLAVTGLGADAPTVFREGVYRTFHISEGNVNILLGVIMVVITFMIDHKQLGAGTIINIFTSSWGMDTVRHLLGETTPINKYVLFIIGIVVIAIGVGMSVAAKLGASYYDAFCIMGGKLIGKSYAYFRYPVDLLMLAGGFFLHGTIGVGTIICLLFLGPIIDLGITVFGKLLKDL